MELIAVNKDFIRLRRRPRLRSETLHFGVGAAYGRG
jgi:hypothetical protein